MIDGVGVTIELLHHFHLSRRRKIIQNKIIQKIRIVGGIYRSSVGNGRWKKWCVIMQYLVNFTHLIREFMEVLWRDSQIVVR